MRYWFNWFTTDPPLVREATHHDAAELAALHASGFERGWSEGEFERLLADRMTIAEVAAPRHGRGPPAGFVLSRLARDEAELLSLVVAPRKQGRGIGRQLLTAHLEHLGALGAAAMFLEVAEDNVAARRLYAGCGFRQVGTRAAYYARHGQPAAALVLRRDLDFARRLVYAPEPPR